jgi:aspartyl/glutamyl-tRNA(Asn/Gln) amidotransferase C subunit
MALDKATVARIAALARIRVTEEEQTRLAGELSQILTWIEQLGEVDTTGVEAMASVAHQMAASATSCSPTRRPIIRQRRRAAFSPCRRWWSDFAYRSRPRRGARRTSRQEILGA